MGRVAFKCDGPIQIISFVMSFTPSFVVVAVVVVSISGKRTIHESESPHITNQQVRDINTRMLQIRTGIDNYAKIYVFHIFIMTPDSILISTGNTNEDWFVSVRN